MTPTDYALTELASWEQALSAQRELEERFEAACRKERAEVILELMRQLARSRTQADLLLAQAVKVKCEFRDLRFITAWVSSTQAQVLDDRTGK